MRGDENRGVRPGYTLLGLHVNKRRPRHRNGCSRTLRPRFWQRFASASTTRGLSAADASRLRASSASLSLSGSTPEMRPTWPRSTSGVTAARTAAIVSGEGRPTPATAAGGPGFVVPSVGLAASRCAHASPGRERSAGSGIRRSVWPGFAPGRWTSSIGAAAGAATWTPPGAGPSGRSGAAVKPASSATGRPDATCGLSRGGSSTSRMGSWQGSTDTEIRRHGSSSTQRKLRGCVRSRRAVCAPGRGRVPPERTSGVTGCRRSRPEVDAAPAHGAGDILKM